jgi:hypothetical protein
VALKGLNFRTFVLYPLAIAKLLPDEKSNDVDWFNVLWFNTFFKLQNMSLTEIIQFGNLAFGSFGV